MEKNINAFMLDYFQDSVNPEHVKECARLLKTSIKNKELDGEIREADYIHKSEMEYKIEQAENLTIVDKLGQDLIPKSDVQEILKDLKKKMEVKEGYSIGPLHTMGVESTAKACRDLIDEAIKTVAERLK